MYQALNQALTAVEQRNLLLEKQIEDLNKSVIASNMKNQFLKK